MKENKTTNAAKVIPATNGNAEAEKKLKESEEKFEAAVAAVKGIVWTNNAIGKMEGEQAAWAALTGQSYQQYQGYGWAQAVHPLDAQPTIDAWQQAVNTKSTFVFEHRLRVKDNTWRLFSIRAVPLKNTDGSIRGWVGVHTDITDEREAAIKLKQSEEQFSTLADNILQLAWMADDKGWIYWYNKRWYDYTGTTLKEMQGWGWQKVQHPDHVEQVVEFIKNAWLQNEPWELTFPLKGADGNYKWFLTRAYPILNDDGKILRWLGTNTDITEQKVLIEKLAESINKLRLYEKVVVNTKEAVVITEAEPFNMPGPKIIYVNDAFCEMTGYSREEVIGKTPRILQGPKTDRKQLDKIKAAQQKWQPVKVELINYKKNGEEFYVTFEIVPVANEKGWFTYWVSVQRDVTVNKIAENKLRESEERFRNLADQAPLWVFTSDKDANITYANTAVLNFAGITSYKEFTGQVWQQLVHPDDINKVFENYCAKKSFDMEVRMKRGSTGIYEWLYRKHMALFQEGEFTGYIGTAININEQKITLSQLEYGKALLEAHNEASVDGILLVDTKGKIISFNHRFIELWNMPQHIVDANDDEAALYYATTQLIHPEQFIEKVKSLYEHPDEISLDELEFKDGKIIERYGYPVKAKDGSYYAWSWMFRDITEQRKAERAIQASEKRFRLLADSMPHHIWTGDAKGNLNYFNQSVFDYSGLTLEQINRDGWLQIVHPDDREENIKQWTESLKTGNDFLFEHRFKRYDGEYRWHLSRAVPQKDAKENITIWVGASTDIQKLKEEEQRKGDFIKMVSHELKTPVTSIKGYVQLLLSMLQPGEKVDLSAIPFQSSLQRIDKQVLRLTRLIEEMLDLSRVEESKLDLKNNTFSINDLVTETVEDVLHTSVSHSINITANADGKINGDRDRIQQVLINFINNAIKYSPHNKVVDVAIDAASGNHIAVSVKDSGIGINKSELEKIFERFYRVSGKNEEMYSGFGIGLFIASQIIERHHGKILVESELGKGSVFTFVLPLSN